MATIIFDKHSASLEDRLPECVRQILPLKILEELSRSGIRPKEIEEIRLRANRQASLTLSEGNRFLRTVLTRADIDTIVNAACGGSLYAHRDAIAEGYLTLADGIRIGLCGRASVENRRIIGVYDITGMNIRIPTKIRRLGAPVCRLLQEMGDGRGILIYAPPAGGKTTLLRAVASEMASGKDPWRVAVIDTRGEIGFSLDDPELCLDILTGYPRAAGIEIATRTMNAQLIVCDEIGDVREAEAIVSAQNSGVPFLATAHADGVAGLLRRTGIARLHRAGVFGVYVGIKRRLGGGEFDYTVTSWEEADAILQNCRRARSRS